MPTAGDISTWVDVRPSSRRLRGCFADTLSALVGTFYCDGREEERCEQIDSVGIGRADEASCPQKNPVYPPEQTQTLASQVPCLWYYIADTVVIAIWRTNAMKNLGRVGRRLSGAAVCHCRQRPLARPCHEAPQEMWGQISGACSQLAPENPPVHSHRPDVQRPIAPETIIPILPSLQSGTAMLLKDPNGLQSCRGH